MIRTVVSLLAPVRAALALVVMTTLSLLSASVAAPQVSAESLLLAAALGVASAAVLGSRRLVVMPAVQLLMLPARWTGEVLPHLAGRSTDVEHHPQRPRAPGLV